MTFVARAPDESVNAPPHRPLLDVFTLLAGAAAILFGIYFLLGLAVDYAVQRMPPDFEQQLAANLDMPFDDAKEDKRLAETQETLAGLIRQLPATQYEHRLSIADNDEINAFALPGGRIVITRGLLDSVQSENELAMVLGHELGHFAHRDHLRALGRALVLSIGASIALGGDSDAVNLLMGTLNVAQSRFSQRQETAADLFALELLQRRYGHIGGATDFFEKLAEKEAGWGYWLATHPAPADRVERIRSEAAKRGYRAAPVTQK